MSDALPATRDTTPASSDAAPVRTAGSDTLPAYAVAREAYARGDYVTAARVVAAHIRAGDTSPETKTDLALAMEKLGRLDIAEKLLREALTAPRTRVRTPRALARILGETGRSREGLQVIERLLSLGVDETYLAHPRYDLIADLGDLERAEAIADAAVKAGTKDPGVTFDRGRFRLKLGRYAEGFADYEARWAVRPWTMRHTDIPAWDGKRLGRRTLLVHDEQGFGDTIQFMRFLPLIKPAFGGRVVLEIRENLMPFARNVPGIDRLVARDQPVGKADVQIPIMSLAHRLGTTLETLPNTCPYLSVDGPPFELPGAPGRKLKVGLVWAGKPTNQNDRNRSMRFADMAPLTDISGAVFYSLQTGAAAAERSDHPAGAKVIDLEPSTGPFDRAARAMEELDLIVTVCTGYAHLAGALGRASIVLLGHRADWRWLDGRTDSPWYPSTTLVRQTQTGDWADVIARTRRLIQGLTRTAKKAA